MTHQRPQTTQESNSTCRTLWQVGHWELVILYRFLNNLLDNHFFLQERVFDLSCYSIWIAWMILFIPFPWEIFDKLSCRRWSGKTQEFTGDKIGVWQRFTVEYEAGLPGFCWIVPGSFLIVQSFFWCPKLSHSGVVSIKACGNTYTPIEICFSPSLDS